MAEFHESVVELIRDTRRHLGMTCKEAAAMIGMDASQWRGTEIARRQPYLNNAQRMLGAVGLRLQVVATDAADPEVVPYLTPGEWRALATVAAMHEAAQRNKGRRVHPDLLTAVAKLRHLVVVRRAA